MILLSIDPGKHAMAWAVFKEGTLHACGLGNSALHVKSYDPTHVVIELPQVYRQSKNPNDLVDLAFRAGFWAHTFNEPGVEFETVWPHDWKGSRPKSVDNRATRKDMTEAELKLLPDLPDGKLHNVIDAIGIGLWKLGRKR